MPGDRLAGGGFNYFNRGQDQAIPLADFQYAVRVSSQILNDSVPIANGAFLKIDQGANMLALVQSGRPMLEVSLRPAIDQARAGQRDNPPSGGLKPIRIEGRNPQAALLAVLRSLRGTVARDSTGITGIEGEVFLRLPAPRSAPPGPTPPDQAGSGR